jgi:hypothetical protein
MKIQSVFNKSFCKYGRILTGYDVSPILYRLEITTEKPADKVIYEPHHAGIESLPVAAELSACVYGGQKIEIGYCNGNNTKLNCVEYHRGSELNIPCDDIVLLLAPLQSVKNNNLNTKEIEAFKVPRGTVVELYETTLHYAPCSAQGKDGFRVAIVLPDGTNTAKPAVTVHNEEDKLLWACNKWLIAHPESAEAAQGAFSGLTGRNIDIASGKVFG